jgi:hypothetical protein
MRSRFRHFRLVAGAAAAIAALGVGVAVGAEKTETTGKGTPKVYEGQLNCCQHIVVAKTSEGSTHVVNTPPIAAVGKYLVQFDAWSVIGKSDYLDCAAKEVGSTNGYPFGQSANGATESGEPATGAGVFGTPNAAGVIEVAKVGAQVELACSSSNGPEAGKGSYVASATIIATKVGTLVKDVQP